MIETEIIPAKIQMEVVLTEDNTLQVNVVGESANWVMKRFEKSPGFNAGVSSLDSNKRRRVTFTEKRAGDDEWQPFGGKAADLPEESLMWQDSDGDFHFGIAGRDATGGEDYVQTNGGEKLPLSKMVAWRRRPLPYRPAPGGGTAAPAENMQ